MSDPFVEHRHVHMATVGMTASTRAKDFGVGAKTGIDLEAEAEGWLHAPGDMYWSESDLATNSFGQGMTVTPLQMLCFANTIANDGQMMQPHIRLRTIDGDRVIPAAQTTVRTPISPDIAHTIRDIMVQVISDPQGEGKKGRVPGYSVAGKTGTAQIPCATCSTGFETAFQNATFVGFACRRAARHV
jgi:cell division protein FtsI/penicillin-binding protein 2